MVLGGVLERSPHRDAVAVAGVAVGEARRRVAVGQFAVAAACLEYADARREQDRLEPGGRRREGEFAADELAVMLRQQPWPVRCLVARSRRIRSGLPTVWAAFGRGEVDAEQLVTIDRVARRASLTSTVAAIDEAAVAAAQTRSPKQLGAWLLRLVVELEPDAFAARHRRALAERKVTVAQGPDGIGFVTGEMTAADAAAIDAVLAEAARGLRADDPRTIEQRRADIFTDLLLGRISFANEDAAPPTRAEPTTPSPELVEGPEPAHSWIEEEDVDPETGELLSTRRVPVDADGFPIADAQSVAEPGADPSSAAGFVRRPQTVRIGVVVPLSSLLGVDDTPGELADRSGFVPAETLRDTIADLLGRGDQVLFTRLLTDDGGRLLDTTELGRYASRRLAEAVRIRAGTCRHPTCTVPADRCDLDHRVPHPEGDTSGENLDPACRRHHRGKTFAWLASVRDGDTVTWTLPDDTRYRTVDDPLPTG